MEKADIYEKLSLCTSEELPVRVAAYHTLTEIFSSLTQASDWGNKITEDIGHSIISNIKQDLFNEKYDVCYEATGFLGCFLAKEKLMDLFTVDEEQEIIDSLIKLLKETKEKTVLTRGLWSLAQSKFECETYSKNLPSLLNLFTDILKYDPTNITIYEALQVVKSLMESVPDNMIDNIDIWLPKIFEYLFHDALKVRGIAYSCLNFCQIYTQERKCLNILNKHVVPFIPKLKSQYCKQMINLLDGNCSFILKIWRLLVIILGQNLHSGTTLINGFLEVVEKAFKCSKPEFRIDAFKCWHVLIGNFSTNIEVLAHPKRLKLLIAPFKSNNAKTEDIALMKLHTWWFFVCKLDDYISTYFDLIVVPLLKFCFDFNRVAQHSTNERKFLMSSSSTSCTKYPNLILKAIEVLSTILNHEQSLLNNFNISLNHPILNNILFMKNYHLVFGCVADSLVCLDPANSYHLKIGCDILQSLLKYVNAILKEYFNKKESFDMVKEFLNIFDHIENECKPGDSITLFYFEFLKLSFLGSQALSSKVLQSRFYHIPVRSKIRDIMNGCLANYFIHKLCKPVLLYYASSDPGYLEIWRTALQKGKAYHKLEFFESVIEELENALSYPGLQAPDVLVSLWSSTSKALDSYIEETRQINQGDCSDHDWTCIYNTLMFPLYSSKYLHCINDTSYTNLIADWAKLWNSFTSLTALTATAEPNSEAEFLTKKMYSLIQSFTPSSEAYGFTLALFTEILFHIIEKFRFKELWNKSKTFQSPLVLKKKLNPLSNLGSIIELLMKLMSLAIDMVSYWRNKTMQKLCGSLIKIFSSILQENLAWIVVCNINDVMKLALQINPRAKFNVDTEKIFVAMWNSFCGLIECRIVPNLAQDKLEFLSPLICIALQSSHLSLRQRTRLMWSTSFTSTSLIIPKSLLSTLETVDLPPASDGDSTSLDSQAMPLQEDKDEIMPLDFKHFNQESLNVSPRVDLKLKLSPLSSIKKRELRGTKNQKQVKIFGIDEIKSNDFVVVSSPNVNKRIFTKKQMEKMKERSADIPALYNDMSQSMSQSDFDTINQNGMKMRNESYFSNKNIRIDSNGLQELNDSFVSEMKSYSDEELNEVLRDASQEFEKSLSNSVIILETSKEIEDFKNIQSSGCHKRKSQTPSKKTISDIKKKLKGTLRNSKSSVENKNSAIHGSILKQSNEDLSPLASPLNSPVQNSNKNEHIDCNNENLLIQTSPKLSPKLYDYNFQEKNDKRYLEEIECSPKNMNETFATSDDEIPDSQVELLESNHLFSLSGNRPRRNKRKSIFENSSMYVTPHKRSKLSLSPPKSEQTFLEDYSKSQNVFCFSKHENNSSKIVGTKPFSRDNSSEPDKSRSETSTSPSTPCKITRSGRRVIAPNKDMPEPMTPPGLKLKKYILKENEFENKTLLSSEILSTKIFDSKLHSDKDYILKDKKSKSEMAEIHHQSSYKESETTNFTPASDAESRACCNYEEKVVGFNKQNYGKNIDSINEGERSIACKIKFPDKVDNKNDAIDKSQVHCDINIAYRSPQEHFRKAPLEEAPVCEEATMSNEDQGINSDTLNLNSSDVQSMMINNLDSCSLISSSDTIMSVKDEVNNRRTLVAAKSSYSSSLNSNKNVSKPQSNIDNSSNLNEKDIEIVSKNFCKLSVIKNKDACKVSEFSKEIHVANGGIVFINSNDLQKQISKRRTGYLLRKCRSLENFSPTKTNFDIFQKNSVKSLNYENKKILIISSPKTSSSPVKKDVYSPKTYEGYLKIKSNSSEIYIKSRGNAKNENLIYTKNDSKNSTSIIERVYIKENSYKLLNDLSPHFSESEGNKISNSNEPSEENTFEIDEHSLDKETQDLNEKKRPKTITKKHKGVLKRKSKSGKMHHNKSSFSNPEENEIQNNLDTTSVRKGTEKFTNDTNDFKCASDKESPDKGNSKLSNSISTPERKKCSAKKMQITGTRAAVMLACAKKHLKTRDENLDSMPEGHTSEMGFDDRNLQNEDDIVNQISSNITPIRKCSISIINDPVPEERPWVKHEPSPRSSPCGSILKKQRLRDFSKRSIIGDIVTESAEDSPLMWKSRRVSFADPPVSERVEIPPSPQILKSHKAQKRLDMSQVLDSTNQHFEIFPSSEEIEMSDVLLTTSSYNAPLYSSLLGCSEHVDVILPMLTTPSLIESLKIVFKDRGIRTVGDLSSLSEMELQSLPVRSPKSSNTIKCLKEFESRQNSKREEKSLITNSTPGLVKETKIAISNASSAAEQEKETENSSLCFSNGLNCSLTFESDDVRRNASFVKDALEKQEYFSSQQTQKIDAKSIQDDEIIKKFCNQVTEDENLVTSFIQGLSEETRLNIFKGLTKVIPYKDLIDIFCQYLKQQK